MKTALMKTDLWDDDTIFGLNVDTKLLYLIILTSPERGVGRIYKLGNRLQSFRTGLNVDQLKVCQEQLQRLGLVFFHDGYVFPTEKSSFVQPVRGKLTSITLQREIAAIPGSVVKMFKDLLEQQRGEHVEGLLWLTGESPVHDNDYVNDIDIDIVSDIDELIGKGKKEKEIPEQAKQLAARLFNWLKKNNPKNNGYKNEKQMEKSIQNWSDPIEKIQRLDGYSWQDITDIIDWSQQHHFWQQNIESGKTLRKQFGKLVNQREADKKPKDAYGKPLKPYVQYGASPAVKKPKNEPEQKRAAPDSEAVEKFRKMKQELLQKKAAKGN